jgi:FMN phosphatase YigB (HAD superfamily)
MAGNVAPEETLHVGDSFRKDYIPARAVGMHAVLVDRFKTLEAQKWSAAGAPVFPDLVSVREWLTKEETAKVAGNNIN